MSKRTAIVIPLWKGGPPLFVEKGTTTKIALGVEKGDKSFAVNPDNGAVLMEGAAEDFVRSLGYGIEPAGQLGKVAYDALNIRACREALYSKGWAERPPRTERTPKVGSPTPKVGSPTPKNRSASKDARKTQFSKETCPEYGRLQALQSKYPYKGKPRINPNGSGMLFSMPDSKGKEALATYEGEGKFRPAGTQDIRDMEQGTKTLARNKWAARILAEEWDAPSEA